MRADCFDFVFSSAAAVDDALDDSRAGGLDCFCRTPGPSSSSSSSSPSTSSSAAVALVMLEVDGSTLLAASSRRSTLSYPYQPRMSFIAVSASSYNEKDNSKRETSITPQTIATDDIETRNRNEIFVIYFPVNTAPLSNLGANRAAVLHFMPSAQYVCLTAGDFPRTDRNDERSETSIDRVAPAIGFRFRGYRATHYGIIWQHIYIRARPRPRCSAMMDRGLEDASIRSFSTAACFAACSTT
uniref:Uncharacterized protein n=1 Tax=Anopheles coluzzii TaxID=1518534 RepID=A0A8W7PHR7_ANOCL